MKPFELEIFDRNFNFIFNALVNEADFTFKYDAISPEKNTIAVPKTFQPKSISNEPRAPKGWYIRIFRDSEEYQGVISGYEEGISQNTIEYSQLVTLFNNEIYIDSQSTLDASIESVIKSCLVSDYINNSDTQQNITGLLQNNITTTSSTTGIMDFFNSKDFTDDSAVIINLMNELILKATELYNIFFKIYFNVAQKRFYVGIGKLSATAKTIEADLQNDLSKNIVIRKTNKEVNKVSIYDTHYNRVYNYYLHTDGTYSQVNSDRIYPVVNEVHTLDTYTEAKEKIDTELDNNKKIVNTYAEATHTLSQNQVTALNSALAYLMPKVREYYIAHALIGTVAENVDTYTTNDPVVIGDKNIEFTPNAVGGWSTNGGYNIDATYLNIGDSSITYSYSAIQNRKVAISGEANVYVHTTGDNSYSEDITPIVPMTNSDFNSAYNEYFGSPEYENDVKAESGTIIQEDANEIAKKAFSSNKYSNYIELTYQKDDSMINPLTMAIGQEVNIIHEGIAYNSILSGREIQKNGLVKLIFGTIRLELTKILNMKGV